MDFDKLYCLDCGVKVTCTPEEIKEFKADPKLCFKYCSPKNIFCVRCRIKPNIKRLFKLTEDFIKMQTDIQKQGIPQEYAKEFIYDP